MIMCLSKTQPLSKKKLKTAEFFSLCVLSGYRAYEGGKNFRVFSVEKTIAESAKKEMKNCVGFVFCRKKCVFLRQI